MGNWFVRHHARSRAFFLGAAASCEDAFWFLAGMETVDEPQNYLLRLAQEKGFLETVFNAIQEGIVVTDSSGRITYLNDAACELFGLDGEGSIGKQLDERVGGLDWNALTHSGGPVTRDLEIFYPSNRFIDRKSTRLNSSHLV